MKQKMLINTGTYSQETLDLPSGCYISQHSKGTIDFNPQFSSNLKKLIFWQLNFWDARRRPVSKLVSQCTSQL